MLVIFILFTTKFLNFIILFENKIFLPVQF